MTSAGSGTQAWRPPARHHPELVEWNLSPPPQPAPSQQSNNPACPPAPTHAQTHGHRLGDHNIHRIADPEVGAERRPPLRKPRPPPPLPPDLLRRPSRVHDPLSGARLRPLKPRDHPWAHPRARQEAGAESLGRPGSGPPSAARGGPGGGTGKGPDNGEAGPGGVRASPWRPRPVP